MEARLRWLIEDRKDNPKLLSFASWPSATINPQMLELPMFRINFHGLKLFEQFKFDCITMWHKPETGNIHSTWYTYNGTTTGLDVQSIKPECNLQHDNTIMADQTNQIISNLS